MSAPSEERVKIWERMRDDYLGVPPEDRDSIADLRCWAMNILATPYEHAAEMVAEDPSVMDVPAAYILLLEAKLQKSGEP